MSLASDEPTSSTLLREVADWANHPAWVRFRARYDPLIRIWCSGFGLDGDSVDEVCQRIWIELAERMKTFRYDPDRTFRGWLKRLCKSRAVDFLRQQPALNLLSLDDLGCGLETAERGDSSGEAEEDEEANDLNRRLLFDEAEQVLSAVKARVNPRTWAAFWLVSVCNRTVEETARELGVTRIAVYAATARVARMLYDEGQRVRNRRSAGSGGSAGSDRPSI